MDEQSRRLAAIFMTILMIGWLVAMAVPGGVVGETQNNEFDDQFTDVSDDLTVWERAVLPLRADTTAAATTVEMQPTFIQSPDLEQTSANRDEFAVYDPGTVDVDFTGVSGANIEPFEGEDAQLIVASFEGNPETETVGGLDEINEIIDPALDGNLEQLRTEADERDITFQVQDTEFGANGVVEESIQAESGPHAVMLVRVDDEAGEGFGVDNDELLTLDGAATIVGTEAFLVQQDSSSVNAPETVAPGEDISLTADSTLDGDVTHGVFVYNEDTFLGTGEQTNIRVESNDLSSFSSEDIVLEHTIAEVNGVSEMRDATNLFGLDVTSRIISGTVSLGDIVDQLAEATDQNVQRVAIGDTTLDASGVIVEGGSSEDLTVETFDNWTEGQYRVVHVAEDGTIGGIETSTQTFEVADDEAPTLDAIDLELDETTLQLSETTEATVTASFSDGSTPDVTDVSTIESDDTSVATVDGTTITAEETGTTTITASYIDAEGDEESDSVELTVEVDAPATGGGGGGGGGFTPAPDPDPAQTDRTAVAIRDRSPGTPGTETRINRTSLESITFGDNATGTVSIREYNALPEGWAEFTQKPFVAGYQITVPESLQNDAAVLRAHVSDERLEATGVEAEELSFYRGVGEDYEELETTVETTADGAIVEAETPGFSRFIISTGEPTVDPAEPETPTPEQTPDPETPPATPTPDDQTGFGIWLAFIALLGAALLAVRRTDS